MTDKSDRMKRLIERAGDAYAPPEELDRVHTEIAQLSRALSDDDHREVKAWRNEQRRPGQ